MATRTGLGSISASTRPAYQQATRRAGGVSFVYPGFGRDPALAGAMPAAAAPIPVAPPVQIPQAAPPPPAAGNDPAEDERERQASIAAMNSGGGANGDPSNPNDNVSPNQSLTGVLSAISNASSALNPFGAFTALALSDMLGLPPSLSLTQVARGAMTPATPENVSAEDDGTGGGLKSETTSTVTPDNPLSGSDADDAGTVNEGATPGGIDGGLKGEAPGAATGDFGYGASDGFGSDGSPQGEGSASGGMDGGSKGDTEGTGNSGPDGGYGDGGDYGGDGGSGSAGGEGGAGVGGEPGDGGHYMKGGYTGAGADGVVQPEKPAGTVHEGEIVIPHHMVKQGHGMDALAQLKAGGRQAQPQANGAGGVPGVAPGSMMIEASAGGGPNDVAPFHMPMGGRGAQDPEFMPMGAGMGEMDDMEDAYGAEGMGGDYDMGAAPAPTDSSVPPMTTVQTQDDMAFGAGMQGSDASPIGPRYTGEATPYADVQKGRDPFTPIDETQGVTGEGAMARLASLPPAAQQAVLQVIGSDPMISSALLHMLGPQFQKMISAALQAGAPPPQMGGGVDGGMMMPGGGGGPPPGMMG